MGRTACTEPQCLYSTAVPLHPLWAVRPVQSLSVCTVELYLYSPLRAVRPVQSLSACTVQLYLYYPYGPYGLFRSSVPVQYSYICTPPMCRTACTEPQCLYSTAIPLLPLWAVRPVQNFSACTVELYHYSPYGPYGLYRASVRVQYSYRSTHPLGRTACTEPQCLYKSALYPTVSYSLYCAALSGQ